MRRGQAKAMYDAAVRVSLPEGLSQGSRKRSCTFAHRLPLPELLLRILLLLRVPSSILLLLWLLIPRLLHVHLRLLLVLGLLLLLLLVLRLRLLLRLLVLILRLRLLWLR
jgi:hypothetical protein